MRSRLLFIIFLAILIASLSVIPAIADAITIDGTFTDWATIVPYIDDEGVDDESSPARADITEFRVDATSTGTYLLMAWDNTGFTGGQQSTAGVTYRNAAGSYFRIYATAGGNPASVLLSSLQIFSCSNSTCPNPQTLVCTGNGCTGAQLASGTTWTDPFSHTISDCAGTNCTAQDTAAEILVPWVLVGGMPANGEIIFFQFGSYPSGPGAALEDSNGPNGISCRNENGTIVCYKSTPTVVTLRNLTASTKNAAWGMPGLIGLVLFLSIAWALRRHAAPKILH